MSKTLSLLAAAMAMVITAASCSVKDAIVRVETPARPAGQESALGMTVPPIDTVRVGFVGLGMRGEDAVVRFTYIPGIKITALCDVVPETLERSQKNLVERGFPEAAGYTGSETSYEALCEREDVDLVYICTDWKHHVPVALYAMEHGKHVAIEVPAAQTMDEIWALINTSERTRRHCIMLENCCYDFFEMSVLAIAQAGVFGEVVHAEGSYHHNLDPFWDAYWNNWRLDFNQSHRGDVYPTHGLGPIAQVLNLHRGDRMKTLVAMDTKAVNGPKHVEAKTGQPCEEFLNGDVTMTIVRTEKGKSILIEHDVMTPRPYDRMYQIVGSEGYAAKYPMQTLCLREEALDGREPAYDKLGREKVIRGDELKALQEQYPNPILTPELEALAREVGGHGGMDFIMDYRLIYCLHNGLPLDMDVYDMAEWCCLGPLGWLSMENGCAPVEVPDFTRGGWDVVNGFSYAFAE